MVAGVQSTQRSGGVAWATDLAARVSRPAETNAPALDTRPETMSELPAPAPTRGTGHDRALLDGVTLDRPFEIVSTVLTNGVEHLTGTRDERSGRALTQVALAGQQMLQAGLRAAARGSGVIAAGSSVLGKVIPVVGVAAGVAQIWKGWNELDSHRDGILSLLHSRTARTGLLQTAASALLLVPGVGSAIGGAVLRLGAAANEMDMFHSLDWSTHRVEDQGRAVAERVHIFDATPTVAHDRDQVSARTAAVANLGAVVARRRADASIAPVPPYGAFALPAAA
ncbi:MAG: hypothetical protein JWN41_1383 [Thermoleophilia bacterium]|nr:hypothetical protein [Thermoleophilia bacterium]